MCAAAELLGVSASDGRGQTFIILQPSVLSGKRPRGKKKCNKCHGGAISIVMLVELNTHTKRTEQNIKQKDDILPGRTEK